MLDSNKETEGPIEESVLAATVLILKGGGAKGLAFVGAVEALQQYGARFDTFVGTSAGAITAAFLAADMSPRALEAVAGHDFSELLDSKASLLGRVMAAVFRGWIHSGDALREWLRSEMLNHVRRTQRQPNRTDPVRLGELKHRLIAIASSRTSGKHIFDSRPQTAAAAFGALDVAEVVYASAAIPWFFKPAQLPDTHYDGGVLANLPIDEFRALAPGQPFVALHLNDRSTGLALPRFFRRLGTASVIEDLLNIELQQNEPELLAKYSERVIHIDVFPVRTLDFSLTPDDRELLLLAGRLAVLRHLAHYVPSAGVTAAELSTAIENVETVREKAVIRRRIKRARERATARAIIAALAIALTAIVAFFSWPRVVAFVASKFPPVVAATPIPTPPKTVVLVGSSSFVNYLVCAQFDVTRPIIDGTEQANLLLLETGSESGKEVLEKAYWGGVDDHMESVAPVLAIASEPLQWCSNTQTPSTNAKPERAGPRKVYQADIPQDCDAGKEGGYFRIKLTDRAFQAVRFVTPEGAAKKAEDVFWQTDGVNPNWRYVAHPQRGEATCVRQSPGVTPGDDLDCLSSESMKFFISRNGLDVAKAANDVHLDVYAPGGSSGTRLQLLDIGLEWNKDAKSSKDFRDDMAWWPQKRWNLRLESVGTGLAALFGSESAYDEIADGGVKRECLRWDAAEQAKYSIKSYRLCRPEGQSCVVYDRVYSIYGRLHRSDGSKCLPSARDASADRCQLSKPECAIVRSMLRAAALHDGPNAIANKALNALHEDCSFVRTNGKLVFEVE